MLTALRCCTVLYIAFAFGMSLTATAWCMSRVSGSLYNPAVSYAESFPFARLFHLRPRNSSLI